MFPVDAHRSKNLWKVINILRWHTSVHCQHVESLVIIQVTLTSANSTLLHCTVLHCTALHWTALYCTTPDPPLNCTALAKKFTIRHGFWSGQYFVSHLGHIYRAALSFVVTHRHCTVKFLLSNGCVASIYLQCQEQKVQHAFTKQKIALHWQLKYKTSNWETNYYVIF